MNIQVFRGLSIAEQLAPVFCSFLSFSPYSFSPHADCFKAEKCHTTLFVCEESISMRLSFLHRVYRVAAERGLREGYPVYIVDAVNSTSSVFGKCRDPAAKGSPDASSIASNSAPTLPLNTEQVFFTRWRGLYFIRSSVAPKNISVCLISCITPGICLEDKGIRGRILPAVKPCIRAYYSCKPFVFRIHKALYRSPL